ncbi:MAG TPA: hypothetical protein VFP44_02660 [Usitatibacter sp.]|nr:hypothetical protein [Usitatibacter sp.]
MKLAPGASIELPPDWRQQWALRGLFRLDGDGDLDRRAVPSLHACVIAFIKYTARDVNVNSRAVSSPDTRADSREGRAQRG